MFLACPRFVGDKTSVDLVQFGVRPDESSWHRPRPEDEDWRAARNESVSTERVHRKATYSTHFWTESKLPRVRATSKVIRSAVGYNQDERESGLTEVPEVTREENRRLGVDEMLSDRMRDGCPFRGRGAARRG